MLPLHQIRAQMHDARGINRLVRALEVSSIATSHRLQAQVEQTRAYALKSADMLNHLAACDEAVGQHIALGGHGASHSLGLILITSNIGIAGAYDANVIQAALDYIEPAGEDVSLFTLGRKGLEAMVRRGIRLHADYSHLDERARLEDIRPLAALALEGYMRRSYGRIAIAYTELRQGALHRPRIRELLPMSLAPVPRSRPYIVEPDAAQFLEMLLPRILCLQIHAALVESLAAEHASRALALRTATNNAAEIVRRLTLDYNKRRQQAVTEASLGLRPGDTDMGRRSGP